MLFWLRTRLAQPSLGNSSIIRLASASVVLGFSAITDAHALSVGQMTTNGRINPLGIGGDALSLAWSIEADTRGTVQGAYRVRVGTTEGADDVWDSGRVASDRQTDIALPASRPLRPATRYYWQAKIWDGNGTESAWSAPAWFETGLPAAEWADTKWIAHPQPAPASNGQSVAAGALPLFRRVITLAKPVKRARLYATAHGVYQFSLNGQKVGDQFLAPGWTDYTHRLQTQTYDVTPLLHTGDNALGAALADGWYRGKVGLNWPGIYGDTLAVIAKLRVTYADGSTEDFVTDESWRSSEGPFVQADLQDGETYDARREQPGWDRADFDASKWLPVAVVPGDSRVLVPQPDEPVRATELVTARSRSEPVPGEYVYDLGQNLIGFARIKLTGKAGQTVRLRFAEEINRQASAAAASTPKAFAPRRRRTPTPSPATRRWCTSPRSPSTASATSKSQAPRCHRRLATSPPSSSAPICATPATCASRTR